MLIQALINGAVLTWCINIVFFHILDVDWLLYNKFYLNVVCMRCDVKIIRFLLYVFWFPSLQHNCNSNYCNKYLNLHDGLLYVIMLDVAMMFMELLHTKYDFVRVMECAVHHCWLCCIFNFISCDFKWEMVIVLLVTR